jgi:hypothetical protein
MQLTGLIAMGKMPGIIGPNQNRQAVPAKFSCHITMSFIKHRTGTDLRTPILIPYRLSAF